MRRGPDCTVADAGHENPRTEILLSHHAAGVEKVPANICVLRLLSVPMSTALNYGVSTLKPCADAGTCARSRPARNALELSPRTPKSAEPSSTTRAPRSNAITTAPFSSRSQPGLSLALGSTLSEFHTAPATCATVATGAGDLIIRTSIATAAAATIPAAHRANGKRTIFPLSAASACALRTECAPGQDAVGIGPPRRSTCKNPRAKIRPFTEICGIRKRGEKRFLHEVIDPMELHRLKAGGNAAQTFSAPARTR
jgi:hypothetical protein